MANVLAHANTYIGLPIRNAQNAMMLYKFLIDSLNDDARLTMLTLKEQYHVNDVPDGILLLKSIIGRASIDTKAKVLLLRESISHLYVKINDFKGNVRDFNEHVSEISAALRGRGQNVEELIMPLFKAYEQVPDAQFSRYIETIRDRYDADEDITADQLMTMAVTKYDLITQRNSMPSDANAEKIVALQAKIKDLKSGEGSKLRKFKKRDAWKLIAPKPNEDVTKLVNGRNYHYCQFHKQWTAHSPAECDRNPDNQKNNQPSPQQPNDKNAEADKMVINKAYQAIIHGDDSDVEIE
jgi:hypothetical protein